MYQLNSKELPLKSKTLFLFKNEALSALKKGFALIRNQDIVLVQTQDRALAQKRDIVLTPNKDIVPVQKQTLFSFQPRHCSCSRRETFSCSETRHSYGYKTE